MGLVRIFGTTITETTAALSKQRTMKTGYGETAQVDSDDRMKAIMRIIITLLLLALAAYLLISNPDSEDKAIPAAIIGAVTGYWLK